MAKGREKQLTPYQKLAIKKMAMFKKAYAQASKNKEQASTGHTTQYTSHGKKNLEVGELENHFGKDGASQCLDNSEKCKKRGKSKCNKRKASLGIPRIILVFLVLLVSNQANAGIKAEKLDSLRISVAKDSPMWETLDLCLKAVNTKSLDLLVPRLAQLVRSGVGLNTR